MSVETPHNQIHGIIGGIMASFQSSFHPIFWLHHNNVDRLFEGCAHCSQTIDQSIPPLGCATPANSMRRLSLLRDPDRDQS
eukprot:SAG22_NODE_5309_length_1040_cov_0.801275_2_plen_81_part_00